MLTAQRRQIYRYRTSIAMSEWQHQGGRNGGLPFTAIGLLTRCADSKLVVPHTCHIQGAIAVRRGNSRSVHGADRRLCLTWSAIKHSPDLPSWS